MLFRSLAAGVPAVVLAVALTAGPSVAQTADQPVLHLQQAFSRAISDAPGLRAAAAASRSAEAGVRQAGRRPNPVISLDAENLGGSGVYEGIERAETTLSLSQTLELGGDRRARTELAQTSVTSAKAEEAIRRLDLFLAVETSYIAAQVAAADLNVANERLALAREIVATVNRRVEAARDPLMAAARARAVLAEAELAVERAGLSDDLARRQLASYWSGDAEFSVDLASFGRIEPPAASGAGTPEIDASRAAEQRAAAAARLERAKAQPDPAIGGGIRYFNEFDEAALVFSFSIPLQAYDRNTGAIARAEAEQARSRLETEALQRDLDRQIAAARSQVGIARAEIEAIDARLLPAANDALEQARSGYAAGAFSYLDVLDAQRVLASASLQRNSAFGSYHRARAALARLTGAYADVVPAEASR